MENYDRAAVNKQILADIDAKMAEQEADPRVAEVAFELSVAEVEIEALLAQFSEAETDAVLDGVFTDENGHVRTTYTG